MSLEIIEDQKLDILIDLKYGTKDNVTENIIYKNPVLMLHKDAVKCLKKAIAISKSMGYKIKIFDGFRPLEAQKYLYDAFPGSDYVSNPDSGIATHTRGIAIDLTLADDKGNDIDMGTDFDSFEEKAHHGSDEVSAEITKNRMILLGIMTLSGFDYYKKEWWHYQLPQPLKYPKLYDKEAPISMMKSSHQ